MTSPSPATTSGHTERTPSVRLRAEADRLEALVEKSERAKLWENRTRQPHPHRALAIGYRAAADFLDGNDPTRPGKAPRN